MTYAKYYTQYDLQLSLEQINVLIALSFLIQVVFSYYTFSCMNKFKERKGKEPNFAQSTKYKSRPYCDQFMTTQFRTKKDKGLLGRLDF